MLNQLRAIIWRRGRGFITWNFDYIQSSKEVWFTTPGWYCHRRRFTYRITVDHDFPQKPIWLGRRERGKWQNMEGLYEPITIVHPDYIFSTSGLLTRPRRSSSRRRNSADMVRAVVLAREFYQHGN